MDKPNILICANPDCLGKRMRIDQLQQHYQDKGHQVLLHENFCQEIRENAFTTQFANQDKGMIFAGCSPIALETRIKSMVGKPVEIANIREQGEWAYQDGDLATARCKQLIDLALLQLKYTKPYTAPENVLKDRLTKYIKTLDDFGPNPFKV